MITNSPHVAIIILNWNGWQDTIECLESVYRITYPNYTVILVDNGSEDDSLEQIRSYCAGGILVEPKFFVYNPTNKPIKIIEYTQEEADVERAKEDEIINFPSYRKMILIKNEKNYGFAEGNNIGIRFALRLLNPPYILLLNNDTVVERNFLTNLVVSMLDNKKIGICQSKILLKNDPERVDAIGISLDIFGRAHQIGHLSSNASIFNEKREIFGACACSAFYRTKMLKQIGLLDEDFFAYYEDVDISWRARLYGWICECNPNSIVYHIHSSSGSKIKDYFLARNEIFYLIKNAPIKTIFYYFIQATISIPFQLLKQKNKKIILKIVQGRIDSIKYIPKMMKKRAIIQSSIDYAR